MQQQAMAGGEARKGHEDTGSAEESSKRPSFRTMGRGGNQSEQKEGQDKGQRGGHGGGPDAILSEAIEKHKDLQ